MTLHWYRSRLFWLGLPGFLFLLWIWGTYLRTPTSVSWGTKKAEYCLGWGDANIGFVINKHETYTGLEGSPDLGFYSSQDPLEPEDETRFFAPALYLDKDRLGIFVGIWVVAALYITVWLGGLAIWQRRKHRWMKSHGRRTVPLV